MAFTLVQSTSSVYTNAGLTPALAFASNVTAGNLLIAAFCAFESTSITFAVPTDGQSNVWSLDQNRTLNAVTVRFAIASAIAGSSGALTVTQHWTRGGAGTVKAFIAIAEFAVPAASPYDANGSGNSFTASSNSSICTSTGSSAENDELQIAFGMSASANASTGHSAVSGWTDFGLEQNGSTNLNGHAVYRLLNTAGAQSITMACTGGSNGGFGVVLAGYRQLAATGQPTASRRHAIPGARLGGQTFGRGW